MKLIPYGANKNEVQFANGTRVFFSYQTPVAAWVPGHGYLRSVTKYSVTTSRHVNEWLAGATATEVEQYKLDDLIEG